MAIREYKIKNFLTTTDLQTITDCLQGCKLLHVHQEVGGNKVFVFESIYNGFTDTVTVTKDGSIVGKFVCDEEQKGENPSTDDISSLIVGMSIERVVPIDPEDGIDPSAGIIMQFHEQTEDDFYNELLAIKPTINADGVAVLDIECKRCKELSFPLSME